jgi:hypothetical protein
MDFDGDSSRGASFAEEQAMKLSDQQALPRRTMLAGAGTATALVAAAALLPGRQANSPPENAVAQAPVDDHPLGYRLTEHVQQYYRTARV